MAGMAINGQGRIGRTALKFLEQAAGEANDAFREEAASDRYDAVLAVGDNPVVSADTIGDPRASVVDAAMARRVDQTLVKVMSWYYNE